MSALPPLADHRRAALLAFVALGATPGADGVTAGQVAAAASLDAGQAWLACAQLRHLGLVVLHDPDVPFGEPEPPGAMSLTPTGVAAADTLSGDAKKNPFRRLRDDTNKVIEEMLADLQSASEDFDKVADWIDDWRKARGQSGMEDWRWFLRGDGDDLYKLDFGTRDEAIAAAPEAARTGDIIVENGYFQIINARYWADMLDEGKDEIPFARCRNGEKHPLPAGCDQ